MDAEKMVTLGDVDALYHGFMARMALFGADWRQGRESDADPMSIFLQEFARLGSLIQRALGRSKAQCRGLPADTPLPESVLHCFQSLQAWCAQEQWVFEYTRGL